MCIECIKSFFITRCFSLDYSKPRISEQNSIHPSMEVSHDDVKRRSQNRTAKAHHFKVSQWPECQRWTRRIPFSSYVARIRLINKSSKDLGFKKPILNHTMPLTVNTRQQEEGWKSGFGISHPGYKLCVHALLAV